jgi:hypothetical protein
MRHKHIAEVMDYVAEGVKEFASNNKAAQFAKDGYGVLLLDGLERTGLLWIRFVPCKRLLQPYLNTKRKRLYSQCMLR